LPPEAGGSSGAKVNVDSIASSMSAWDRRRRPDSCTTGDASDASFRSPVDLEGSDTCLTMIDNRLRIA
jgi:hypothetical protein